MASRIADIFIGRGWVIFVLALCLGAVSPALARDQFLVIGGGSFPTENQVSLEKNVLFFQRLLRDTEGAEAGEDIFFADGLLGSRDVQCAAAQKPPRVNELLARLLDPDHADFYQYRPHQIPGVRGPASRRAIANWFDTVGPRLGERDRLFIYFTGHGGQGRQARNTNFTLWGERSMNVTDFAAMLDRLSPQVQVVLIMVQCHAGGFADVIFRDGRLGPRLSRARRCGFFATTYERQAAGCTADIDEDDYHDYSTSFFAALDGKTRTGQKVTPADCDGDGKVSLAEAHAYVLLNSDTIDLPITTSDVLLRQFSRTSGAGFLKSESPYEELIAHASPAQHAVLEGLSKQLALTGSNRVVGARVLANRLDAERRDVQRRRQDRAGNRDGLGRALAGRVTRRWPELANPWNPSAAELVRQQGDAIQRFIESDRLFARFDQADKDTADLDNKDLELERKWIKCQRFLYTSESVALAANLPRVTEESVLQRYQQMIADEAGTLPMVNAPRSSSP